MKKVTASQKEATNIDGPISFNANAVLYSILSICKGTCLSARVIKNMLSTPIANIRNGATSAEIVVNF